MAPKSTVKPRRHKKRKSRTEVSSDSSDSERETKQVKIKSSSQKDSSPSSSPAPEESAKPARGSTDAEIQAAFTKIYMQRATAEFADDLDKIRNADDFKDEAVPVLIRALGQGASLFSVEEMRRVVGAGKEEAEG